MKRGKGEGSIYKRDDGLWVGALNLGYRNGKRKRKVVYGHTRREVVEKLDKLKHDQGLVDISQDRQTVKQFLDSWLTQVIKKYRAEKTYINYEYIVRVRIVPHIGNIQIDRLNAQRIQRMISDITEELHPNSVRYVKTVLVAALNQAVAWGLLPRNPAEHVNVPKARPTEHRIFTEDEAERFLQIVAGHRFEPIYRIALSLGLRMGEIRRLKWEDVNFETGKIYIRPGKTKARTLSLSPVLQSVLREHEENWKLLKEAQADVWKEQGYVFPSEKGNILPEPTLRKHFKRSLNQAGLPDNIRFHDLRHSAASFLLAQKEHPRVIMEILGHSSIKISMDTYAHPSDESMSDALSKLSNRLHSGYNSDEQQSE
jgi:integrase